MSEQTAPGHAPRYLSELTSAQAKESVDRGDIVVIPVGALEQHGPALPLGTDTLRADGLCARVAGRLPHVVVGPTLPIGVSPHHLAMPGTVSFTSATFTTVMREYAVGLHRQGWTKILVVTGHGGNNAALTTLAQDLLGSHPDLQLAWTPVTSLAADAVRAAGVSEVHGHCGEAETSQMLVLSPQSVRTDLLAPGVTTPEQFDPLSALARSVTYPSLARRYDQLSDNGVLGDPRAATRELGEQILEQATDRICDFLTRWADL